MIIVDSAVLLVSLSQSSDMWVCYITSPARVFVSFVYLAAFSASLIPFLIGGSIFSTTSDVDSLLSRVYYVPRTVSSVRRSASLGQWDYYSIPETFFYRVTTAYSRTGRLSSTLTTDSSLLSTAYSRILLA